MASLVTQASSGNLPGKPSAPAADNIRAIGDKAEHQSPSAFARFASPRFVITTDLLLLSQKLSSVSYFGKAIPFLLYQ